MTSHNWNSIQGILDSASGFKTVSASITAEGIYGIFTSGLADVRQYPVTSARNSLVVFYDPNIKSIVVNFDAASEERVSLEIYNILGESVKFIPQQSFAPGPHVVSMPSQELPSGIYFCALRLENGINTAKFVIAR
jgi:hypothetical protein